MSKVDFLFIGPDKTGSSWIFDKLYSHPKCDVPVAKDIYYFDKYYSKGLKWYHSHFDFNNDYRCRGELSHDYMFSQKAIERIKAYNPKIKLLTCLRNPIDRSFSQYCYIKRMGLTKKSLIEATKEYPEIINNSLYFKYLSFVYENFDRKQVKVLFFEDLKDKPKEFARELFNYLDLSFIKMNFSKKIRKSKKARSHYLSKFLKHLSKKIRSYGYPNLLGRLKNNQLVNDILFAEGEEIIKKTEVDYLRKNIISDTIKLQELLNKDLSNWIDA